MEFLSLSKAAKLTGNTPTLLKVLIIRGQLQAIETGGGRYKTTMEWIKSIKPDDLTIDTLKQSTPKGWNLNKQYVSEY